LWLSERGLTLPSSGPAFGSPLKSNVRPRKKPLHESTVVARFTARAAARNSGCRRRVTIEAFRQGSLAPSSSSVERSSRLRGVRPVALARKQARKARALASRPPGHKAKTQSVLFSRGQVAAIPCIHGPQPWRSGFFSQYPSTASVQASLVRPSSPALVCFGIQMQTQTQSTAVAQRAWPNHSFKRTCLRPAA